MIPYRTCRDYDSIKDRSDKFDQSHRSCQSQKARCSPDFRGVGGFYDPIHVAPKLHSKCISGIESQRCETNGALNMNCWSLLVAF